jgi:hypothetical protein
VACVDNWFIRVPSAENWKLLVSEGKKGVSLRCMLTPLMLWFGSSGATSLARGPAQTSSFCVGSEAFLEYVSFGLEDFRVFLHGIAVVVMKQSINVFAVAQTTSKGIKRSVLLNENDNILDLALPVPLVCNIGDSQSEAGEGCNCYKFKPNHFCSFGSDTTAV